ncbi:CHAT domain-containing protein [Nostoc sp. TCL240-02]|uniref:CHAT domain-containing protein n=1 Tax=Nostoc sp. TCL240-02 TaxID=2572090 RepID=UPI00157FA34D|nr:CHAT domain-containing protein [Nostoc sp. TCL240-02]QKQ75114.1 tetratricopeptide repeat protein [Nostoc sp. TCL240-02]
MNKQNNKNHRNLIEQLINCANKREINEIIRNNFDDIDINFLRMLQQEEVRLQQEDNNDKVNLLKDIVRQLAEFLGIEKDELRIAEIESSKLPLKIDGNTSLPTPSIMTSSSVPRSESQHRFILRVLQATDESKGNPQVVYPLLQGNLNLLDDNFAQALTNYATATFSTIKLDTAHATAVAILSFSNMIGQFPLGKRAINLEIAIAGYEAITLFFTNGAFPFEWALTQMNLGNVYIGRIRGEKAENLELAIQAYQQALSVFTREAFPTNWAETQMNLGSAYSNRIVGKKADNFEQAIRCHQQALSVLTREAFPIGWARTQNNLGLAYRERIKGDKAENLEQAINSHQQALSVLTREAFPADWAGIQMNLASAYRERIKGEKAENLERSIHAYQQVLLVLTREAFPMDWAGVQMNLVGAYCNRIRGEKAENIERAIQACQQALLVFTREAFPMDWAGVQMNLVGAYCNRIRGEKAENIERAIQACQQALLVFTREAFPTNWAETQMNLGSAYSSRIKGEKAENTELAIQAYQQALLVFTREAFPTNWAEIQSNLGQLRDALNRNTKVDLRDINGEEIELYFQFLMQLLETTEKSNGNAQLVYPLLAKNLDKLDGLLREILRQWGINKLRDVQPDEAKYLAAVIFKFSNLIAEFPLGSKANNMETTITGYELALTICSQQSLPQSWAEIQNNLGNAYIDRIRGDRADNIENAIAAFTAALTVIRRETQPQDWAMTQNSLAAAYVNRIQGDRADNIENAIVALTDALTVVTRESSPQDWAMMQNSLGIAYCNRIQGNKAENLENAITALTNALTVITRETLPQDWAIMQNVLGIAYLYRTLGDRAENLENAITAFTAALTVMSKEALPQDWAMTQNNLGLAYGNRILGDRAENLENAITAFTNALTVRTREALPQDWAGTQNNLGLAYRNRILGDKAENLENAIDAYKKALTIRTREDLPQDWAGTQNNLGTAYIDRIRGNKLENLENAIDAYEKALTIRTREDLPQDWARMQNNLGTAYGQRIRGDKAENLENAIAALTNALTIYKREVFPQDWAMTQKNLGASYIDRIRGDRAENLENAIAAFSEVLTVYKRDAWPLKYAETLFYLGYVYKEVNQFQSAYTAFESAIRTVESLRDEILSGEETKRKQAEEWNKLYSSMVEACLKLGNTTKAVEYIERSKTRHLVEQILERDSKTIFPLEVVTQLETYRDKIAKGQYQIQNATADDPTALAQHLQQLRQERNELQDRYLPIGSGFQFEPFYLTLSHHTAIVEFYITIDKLLVFIITKQTQQPIVLSSDLIDQNKLANWVNSYLTAYSSKKSHWQRRLTTRLNLLAKILHIDEVIRQIPTECKQLILIPHRYLHLLPLHALPLAEDSNLFDRFPGGVSYAPSCQLLQLAQTRKRPEFTHLFAVQNPTDDLSYTDIEVETIQSYFSKSNLLKQKIATKQAIDDISLSIFHCAHFSCHGYFNATQPRKSALILANAQLDSAPTQLDAENYLSLQNGGVLDLNKCLTLDSIFTLNLKQCRLVTLSACETGLIDSRNISDEYIGLPSGFLYAGASSVVSSLWTVDDLSTAFLMIRFYQNLQKGFTVALALNQAQLWLKDLTKGDLETWIEETQLPLVVRISLRRRFYKSEDDAKPFKSPFCWAAFCAIGQS